MNLTRMARRGGSCCLCCSASEKGSSSSGTDPLLLHCRARTPCAGRRQPTQRRASNETSTSTTEVSNSTSSSSAQPLQPPPASSSSSAEPVAAPVRPARTVYPSSPWTAQTAAISVSGPYITTSSIDGDSLIMSADFLERELVGPYKFNSHQVGWHKTHLYINNFAHNCTHIDAYTQVRRYVQVEQPPDGQAHPSHETCSKLQEHAQNPAPRSLQAAPMLFAW